MNLSARLRAGLRRTAEHLGGRVDEVSVRREQPTQRDAVDPTLEALEEILISSDVGLTATARIVDAVSGRLGEGRLRDLVKAEILAVLTAAEAAPPNGVPLRVILVVG
ncbi:MAG: signal recognition particle receptor subunit alpha, partial [Vicinamibacterales bacterium]|nr:signal recognition particle receptor subunit alpha [Vicinamibacterales bacterium]